MFAEHFARWYIGDWPMMENHKRRCPGPLLMTWDNSVSIRISNYVHSFLCDVIHDDVIKWKHFQRYWPFVQGIHRWPVNSPHKGQRRGALMFSLICAWIHAWVNNSEAGDVRRHCAHYDVTVMTNQWHSFNGVSNKSVVEVRDEYSVYLTRKLHDSFIWT